MSWYIVSYNPNLIELLISTIAKTKDYIDPNFPVKKVKYRALYYLQDLLTKKTDNFGAL